MDIRHFRYFVALGETLSFSRAAQDLNMSQPALSIRIADLEGELGLKLFDRTTRKVKLTTAGAALLPRAREAVQAIDATLRMARALSPSQSRTLRVAVTTDTSRTAVLGIVSRLQQERVNVNIAEACTAEQQRLLAAGEVDVGVLRHPFDKRGLWVSAPLREPLGVIVYAEHPLAKVDKLRLPDLNPYPLAHFPRHESPGLYDELLDLCRAGGYVPPSILHLHAGSIAAAILKTESAVALLAERFVERLGAASKEFLWRPLEHSPVHWWASVVCRSNECVGITRLAANVVYASLQQHENWSPMPRPVKGRRA